MGKILRQGRRFDLGLAELAKLALGEYMDIVAAQPDEGLNEKEKETLIRAAVIRQRKWTQEHRSETS